MRYEITNFIPSGGRHCITCSIRQILRFQGLNLSEAMLFGLGSGLSWFYMENRASYTPILSGRIKPVIFEQQLSDTLGISVSLLRTSSRRKAHQALLKQLAVGQPALVYVDMALLPYLNLPGNAHFGGHSIVVFGVDEEKQTALISDRDSTKTPLTINGRTIQSNCHTISLNDLAAARDSKYRPFPAENKMIHFDSTEYRPEQLPQAVIAAIRRNIPAMTNTPISNMGTTGIHKFAEKITQWERFDQKKFHAASINAFFMIDGRGGTGGGAFRQLYGEFLEEAAVLTGSGLLAACGEEYRNIASDWQQVAAILWRVHKNGRRDYLATASSIIKKIAAREKTVWNEIQNAIHAS